MDRPGKAKFVLFSIVFSAVSSVTNNSLPSDPQIIQNIARPNIILINLDDADRDLLEIDFCAERDYVYLPNIRHMAEKGIRFSNCHVTTPLCCPSRACLFTGQYAHKTEIKTNEPSKPHSRGVPGGYRVFRNHGPFGDVRNTYVDNELGKWLQQTGYHTIMVGKYLHEGYKPSRGENWENIRPPGWNEHYVSMGASYFSTMMVKNGKVSFVGDLKKSDYKTLYRTVVESVDAQNLIRQHVKKSPDPFFLYFAPLAPHSEQPSEHCLLEDEPNRGMVEQRYKSWWTSLKLKRTPDFDESNVSDKPQMIRELPILGEQGDSPMNNEVLRADIEFRRRLLSLKSVDDFVGELLGTLEELEVADNTIVILTSDNGYQLGHHRHFGKALPYNRCTNVPLIFWGPRLIKGSATPKNHLLAHIDLAPTILDIAGVDVPAEVQGKSFAPLLTGQYDGAESEWRPEGVLIENWENVFRGDNSLASSYVSIRTYDQSYTEWSNGEIEFYDLAEDPYQLTNKHRKLPLQNRAEFRRLIALNRNQIPKPICYIETPFENFELFQNEVSLSGLAEAACPVAHVYLRISDVTIPGLQSCWNGKKWTDQNVYVAAKIAAPHSTMSDWKYRFCPPEIGLRHYLVETLVESADGKQQVVDQQKSFSIQLAPIASGN